MKAFSLEEYIKNPNRKIVTRDGKSVRIICTDKKGGDYPIIGLCQITNDIENCFTFSPNGHHSSPTSEFDLFFAPEKHEGWVNVYKGYACYNLGGTVPYQSESEAKKGILKDCGYVGTIKVEWED